MEVLDGTKTWRFLLGDRLALRRVATMLIFYSLALLLLFLYYFVYLREREREREGTFTNGSRYYLFHRFPWALDVKSRPLVFFLCQPPISLHPSILFFFLLSGAVMSYGKDGQPHPGFWQWLWTQAGHWGAGTVR